MKFNAMYTDDTILRWGRYKKMKLGIVPPWYLLRLYKLKRYFNEEFREYIETNIQKIWNRLQEWNARNAKECAKICYSSKKEAKRNLKIVRSEIPHGEKKPVAYYKCKGCNAWHLTSMEKEKWLSDKDLGD